MICRICRKEFTPNKYNKSRQKYCSLKCQYIGLKENYRQNSKKYWRNHPKEYHKNIQRSTKRSNKIRLDNRLQVLIHYGGSPPKCACCGESEIRFLTLDHIHGGGTIERKRIKGNFFYKYLIKNNYPEGYQVLCSNCNMAKGHHDKQFCPIHYPELY